MVSPEQTHAAEEAGDWSDYVVRDDLLITPKKDPPGCVVADEVAGTSYELGEREYFLFQQLEHPRQSVALAALVSGKFNQRCSARDIDEFRALLHGWNLLRLVGPDGNPINVGKDGLEASLDDSAPPPASPNRWHVFNPEKYLDVLTEVLYPVRYLFVASVPFFFCLGIILVARHYSLFLQAVGKSTQEFGFVGKLLMTTITVNVVAQIARGCVARQAGLRVKSAGIFLEIGLIPRFNAHIEANGPVARRTRLWLSATTPLVRFASFGVGVAVWWMARYNETLSFIGVAIAAISFIGLAFSANPLWRTDGAAFFSALLDVPDLRLRSHRMVWDLFRRKPAVLSRHGRAFRRLVIFGLLSILFFYAAFIYIAYDVFDQFERQWNGAGVVLWLVLVIYCGWSIYRMTSFQRSASQRRK
ncbi:MAG: hypothetical protein ACOYOL_06875 [Chthoniobacterales bacterium]